MKAIFPNTTGGIGIVCPTPDFDTEESLKAEAKRVLPQGTPFLIAEDSDLPKDWSLSEGWSADFSKPDGYGEKGE